MALLLNCDLGESFGSWTMGMDASVMPFIDQANIACGFHGGDPLVISKTLTPCQGAGRQGGSAPKLPRSSGFWSPFDELLGR